MSAPESSTSVRPAVWVPADVVRLAGVVGVAVAALWFGGVAIALTLLVLGGLMVPRAMGTPAGLDAAYGTGLIVAAWSAVLEIYRTVALWDLVVHFAVTGLVAAVAYRGMALLGVARDPADAALRGHRVGIPVLVTALGLALSVAWEFGEWLGHTYVDDSIFVTQVDTLGDLAAGGAGSILAGVLLVTWRVGTPEPPGATRGSAGPHG